MLKGKKHSEETKRKMSESRKGENNSMYGKRRVMSEETRKKMSDSHKGKPSGMKGKTLSDETKKLLSEKRKGKNNPMYGKKRTISKETKKKMSRSSKITIEKILERYPLFSKIEEIRYNPENKKEIQVRCKNHNCPNSKEQSGWFTPSGTQLSERIRQIENEDGNGGSYFYCSNKCKNTCILFNFRSDPYENKLVAYTQEEIEMWKNRVKTLDNYECQICGSVDELQVHHIIPKKLQPLFALDPENGICLCKTCHFKYGHSDEGCRINDIKGCYVT